MYLVPSLPEEEKVEAVTDFLFLGSKIAIDGDCTHEIRRWLFLGRKAMTNLDSVKKQRHHLADKGPYSQGCGLSSSHVWLWELDHKEGRAPKNWSFWTVVLEKTLQSPLDCKETKPVNLKGDQPWILIGRTDAAAEAPIPWPSDTNSWLIRKDLDAEKDWKQKKRAIKDETAGCHHRCNEHELGQTPGGGWETRKPGMLQSMETQRVRHNLANEQQRTWIGNFLKKIYKWPTNMKTRSTPLIIREIQGTSQIV